MDLYVSNTCGHCVAVKKLYATLGKPEGMRLRVVDNDPVAMRDLRKLGGTGVPAALVDGKLVSGPAAVLRAMRAKAS